MSIALPSSLALLKRGPPPSEDRLWLRMLRVKLLLNLLVCYMRPGKDCVRIGWLVFSSSRCQFVELFKVFSRKCRRPWADRYTRGCAWFRYTSCLWEVSTTLWLHLVLLTQLVLAQVFVEFSILWVFDRFKVKLHINRCLFQVSHSFDCPPQHGPVTAHYSALWQILVIFIESGLLTTFLQSDVPGMGGIRAHCSLRTTSVFCSRSNLTYWIFGSNFIFKLAERIQKVALDLLLTFSFWFPWWNFQPWKLIQLIILGQITILLTFLGTIVWMGHFWWNFMLLIMRILGNEGGQVHIALTCAESAVFFKFWVWRQMALEYAQAILSRCLQCTVLVFGFQVIHLVLWVVVWIVLCEHALLLCRTDHFRQFCSHRRLTQWF